MKLAVQTVAFQGFHQVQTALFLILPPSQSHWENNLQWCSKLPASISELSGTMQEIQIRNVEVPV